MFSSLSPEMLKVTGVLLILLGLFYLFRMYQALVKGKVTYWAGWLPITLISPWTCFVNAHPKSLVKAKEGMWVHLVMAPLFLISAALAICAGLDLVGLPGTSYLNDAFGGAHGTKAITFSLKQGYNFPFIGQAVVKFGKAMASGQMGIDKEHQMYEKSNQSVGDAMRN
jgi:hypothetical protein